MLSHDMITDLLKEAGVLLEGHFLLTSGKHSGQYLQCAKVFKNARYSEILCKELADKFKDDKIDVVIGPAMGAVIMAYEVSRHLGVPNFFTEREEGAMALRRGFEIEPGMRCLVVEDVVTTGGSALEVIEVVNKAGGVVAGVGSIVDRTGGEMRFPARYEAVYSVKVTAYEPDDCPLCKAGGGAPVKPGSRKRA